MKKRNKKNNDFNNSSWEKINKFFEHFIFKLKSLSTIKQIFIAYFAITLIGSILLSLPFARQAGVSVPYIDVLFTSASAFSDTGLVTMTTSETWSISGQAIIAILILVGGIGVFAIKVYVFNIVFGFAMSYRSGETLSDERGSVKFGVSRHLIQVSVTILLTMIVIFSLILSIYFFSTDVPINENSGNFTSPYLDIGMSIRYGIFHTISAINNAGFDIIGDSSLLPYQFNTFLLSVFMILFIIGGIGFPVIYDTYMFLRGKFVKEKYKFTLFSKLSTLTYILVSVIGVSVVFIFEYTSKDPNAFINQDVYGTSSQKVFSIIFNTMSTRNAGFSSVNFKDFTDPTLLTHVIMMFIGSSPSSTAGGIRTTTIAIVMLVIWKHIRNRTTVRTFNRQINNETVSRALAVFAVAVMLVFLVTFIGFSSLSSFGGQIPASHGYMDILFETTSAFGTTGLSTGITSKLSAGYKISLILIMFVGQLGVSATLQVWSREHNASRSYSYIEEDITTG